jgi:zinc and cadmium transporter
VIEINMEWAYALLSVIAVSIISLIGLITISINEKKLGNILIFFVSFAAGALFGDAFIHLLPEIIKKHGFSLTISGYILTGITASFLVEKIIHWRHCHIMDKSRHVHNFATMNLIGDGVHNLIDGIIIGSSYLVSIPVGLATTIAVILHEIPQELGDFAILLHGGYTKKKATLFNFLMALTSIIGAIAALLLSTMIDDITLFLIPFAAGGFIYIAGTDLIPELHKEVKIYKSLAQLILFILGIAAMFSLTFIEI